MVPVKSEPSWSERAVTHSGLTPQQWEGAVLQLHDDSVQHRQHGGDVQQDQDDGLKDTYALFIHSERGHDLSRLHKNCKVSCGYIQGHFKVLIYCQGIQVIPPQGHKLLDATRGVRHPAVQGSASGGGALLLVT